MSSHGSFRASASATPLLPEAVGPKTARTSPSKGLGGGKGFLRALERRRGRARDPHGDQLTGICGTREIGHCVPPRAAAQESRIRAARALDEQFLDTTD